MDKPQYTKLSALVGDTFTVEKAYGFTWKKFDPDSKRMLISETYEEGYRKIYSLDTDKGKLDVSGSQLGNLLEGTYKNGEANIVGRTFAVKSNGKTGMDIRYFLNPVKEQPKPVEQVFDVSETDEVDLSDIPF
jgi:hypothetical protein